ncbi:MAG: hypothetical protein ACXWZ2_13585, partial [Mycobacterium sp.]
AEQGRRIVMANAGETCDDLVREVIEVLCSRAMGGVVRHKKAMCAVTATKQQSRRWEGAGGAVRSS